MENLKSNDNKTSQEDLERPYYDALRPAREVMEEDLRRHAQSIVQVGDIVELIDGTYMRVDEIEGNQIHMRFTSWLGSAPKHLIRRVGKFVEVERL